jgi:hypothetical protein
MIKTFRLFGGTGPALPQDASALSAAIDAVRQRAIAQGVRPVPPGLYRALLGFYPSALLQKARYAIGNTGSLPYGDALAVTAGDVILFKNERLALADGRLWARELTHIVQYQRWGIEGFSRRWFQDGAAVEQEANDNAARFAAWSRKAA